MSGREKWRWVFGLPPNQWIGIGVIGATIFGIRLVLWALFSDEPPYPALYVILAGASVGAIAVGMSKERRSGQR
jgi:lipid-A-disaccharide synthase-like uncharacterized protein